MYLHIYVYINIYRHTQGLRGLLLTGRSPLCEGEPWIGDWGLGVGECSCHSGEEKTSSHLTDLSDPARTLTVCSDRRDHSVCRHHSDSHQHQLDLNSKFSQPSTPVTRTCSSVPPRKWRRNSTSALQTVERTHQIKLGGWIHPNENTQCLTKGKYTPDTSAYLQCQFFKCWNALKYLWKCEEGLFLWDTVFHKE